MKAYVLSTRYGTVQIGDTIFQPATGARIRADKINLSDYEEIIEVNEASMETAEKALDKVRNPETNF